MSEETTVNPAAENIAPVAENEKVNEAQKITKPKGISPRRQVFIRFFRSKLSVIGLIIIVFLFLLCFLGPVFSPWGEIQQDKSGGQTFYLQRLVEVTDDQGNPVLDPDGNPYYVYDVTYNESDYNSYAKPSASHWFGTDEKAMDVLSRVMYGGRISLTIGFVVIFAETILGVLLGALAGFFGKWVDQLIMRLVEIFQCIPTLPILLIAGLLIDSLGAPPTSRIYYLMLIMTIFGWPGIARIVRGQFLTLREQDYMLAAESLGFSAPRKIFKHLLPNVLPQLIVSMTLGLGSIILYESTLSFLGLGIPYPHAAWGTMISTAVENTDILSNYFHIWLPPGICIVLAVLAFNFIGDGLRDAFDPKGKR